jgi:hypothetical protein
MVCLKASAGEIDAMVGNGFTRLSDFVDEDLDDMRTAIAVGPLDRETAEREFGGLPLA